LSKKLSIIREICIGDPGVIETLKKMQIDEEKKKAEGKADNKTKDGAKKREIKLEDIIPEEFDGSCTLSLIFNRANVNATLQFRQKPVFIPGFSEIRRSYLLRTISKTERLCQM